MANHHFGKLADVWKHLVLDEVLAVVRPGRYAETHAGSASYAMVDDAERRFGVLGYLDALPGSPDLAAAAYSRVVSGPVLGAHPHYPGSPLQAMTLLGDGADYLLCDLDPGSVSDLRAAADRRGLTRCEVVERDGMSAVRRWLGDPRPGLVHVDPFDPHARVPGGASAVKVVAEVAEAGHVLVYWYGVSGLKQRAWALAEIGALTGAPLWCGDLQVAVQDATQDDGTSPGEADLGRATTPGTGCGVVVAHASEAVTGRLRSLGHALVAHYEGRPLPDGSQGRLLLSEHVHE